jgi:hypothetical protein
MGIDCIPVAGLNNDVIARHRSEVCSPFCLESLGVLEKYGEVPGEVDGIPLRPAVLSTNYNSGRRREDGLAPTKAILQSNAEDEVMERAGPIETQPFRLRIYADEFVSVSLAEDVGAVAWDSLARGIWGYPFAPEREVYNDRSKHRGILSLVVPIV